MTFRLLALALCCAASLAAQEPTVHVVDTELRSLGDCPRKHVVTDAESYAKVVEGLADAPPAPDFADHHVALLVFDLGLAGAPEVGVPQVVNDELSVPVVLSGANGTAPKGTLRCVFLTVPKFAGGIVLDQRRELGKGQGYVEKSLPATPSDRLVDALPELGPDLQLSWELETGEPLPLGVQLLHQVRFVKQPELKPRSSKSKVAGARLALRFPALRLDVEHLYAVYLSGAKPLRTRNPLRVTSETLGGAKAKNPPRITHRFILEPVPGQ